MFLGHVGFNGLDMMRMKEDKFECVDRAEGLHADVSSGCQVRTPQYLHIYTNLRFPLFNKYSHFAHWIIGYQHNHLSGMRKHANSNAKKVPKLQNYFRRFIAVFPL